MHITRFSKFYIAIFASHSILFTKVNTGLLRSLSNEFAGVPVFAFFIIMWYSVIGSCTATRLGRIDMGMFICRRGKASVFMFSFCAYLSHITFFRGADNTNK